MGHYAWMPKFGETLLLHPTLWIPSALWYVDHKPADECFVTVYPCLGDKPPLSSDSGFRYEFAFQEEYGQLPLSRSPLLYSNDDMANHFCWIDPMTAKNANREEIIDSFDKLGWFRNEDSLVFSKMFDGEEVLLTYTSVGKVVERQLNHLINENALYAQFIYRFLLENWTRH